MWLVAPETSLPPNLETEEGGLWKDNRALQCSQGGARPAAWGGRESLSSPTLGGQA